MNLEAARIVSRPPFVLGCIKAVNIDARSDVRNFSTNGIFNGSSLRFVPIPFSRCYLWTEGGGDRQEGVVSAACRME